MLKEALDNFGKYVVQQSRSNLTKKDKNVSKGLYNSIKYDTKVSKNSFELTIRLFLIVPFVFLLYYLI